MGVKPPSVNGWVKSGTIDKHNLVKLIDYFADTVQDEHWGLPGLDMSSFGAGHHVINRLINLSQSNALDEADWELINGLIDCMLRRTPG